MKIFAEPLPRSRDGLGAPATMRMVFPSSAAILQRKLVRGIACLDQKMLGSALARRVHAWEDRVFAKGRQMHPMNLDGPEEDEFLLTLSFYSATVAMIFPYIETLDPYARFDDGNLDERCKRCVMRFYRRCVQRTLYLNGTNKVHLSKNPMFAGKVQALLGEFPDARFVVLPGNHHLHMEDPAPVAAALRGFIA